MSGFGRDDHSEPRVDRLAPGDPWRAKILARYRAAIEAAEPGYMDPETGLFVFTAMSLLKRGSCYASGCRHCPYL